VAPEEAAPADTEATEGQEPEEHFEPREWVLVREWRKAWRK
jgi:hypothetical protein